MKLYHQRSLHITHINQNSRDIFHSTYFLVPPSENEHVYINAWRGSRTSRLKNNRTREGIEPKEDYLVKYVATMLHEFYLSIFPPR